MIRRRPNAFSLVELLVVVSIVSLLVALLLPSLKSAREAARSAVCLSQQKQIYYAYMNYAGQFNNYVTPRTWGYGIGAPTSNTGWTQYLYLSNGKPVWLSCREADAEQSLFFCPSAPAKSDNRWDRLTYGMTGYYGIANAKSRGHQGPWQGGVDYPPLRWGDIPRPAETMACADITFSATSHRGWSHMGIAFTGPSWQMGFYARHNDGDNILFAAGNAEYQSDSYPRLNDQFATYTTNSGRALQPFSWQSVYGF